jgi:VanZ family protein
MSPFHRFSHSPFQIKGTPIKKFTIYWLPLIIYCGALFIQSSFAATGQYSVSFFDKILHFTAYALLGILFFRALGTLAIRKRTHLTALLSIMAASLYGLSDEIHQYFVPLRDADMLDWLADVIGSICGVLLYLYTLRRRGAHSETIHGLTK